MCRILSSTRPGEATFDGGVYPTWRLNTVRYEASGLRCSIMDRVFPRVDNTLVLVARRRRALRGARPGTAVDFLSLRTRREAEAMETLCGRPALGYMTVPKVADEPMTVVKLA
jgi:hypothetical protein